MSSRIFQGTLLQLSEASQLTIGVMDAEGTVIACSDTGLISEKWIQAASAVAAMPESPVSIDKRTFLALKGWNPAFGYAVFVKGTDSYSISACRMAQVSLNSTKAYYEEKHDKGTFVKNIITDNILPGDIYIRAKELHFQTEMPRVVFLVRQLGRADVAVVELLQSLFADQQQDFVISVNETDIAIVRQVSAEISGEELCRIARSIEERLKAELFVKSTIGIGTVTAYLRELAD
ncbi:MAG: PucR family transcriptional regulator, partial [Oscillospiraceae bacterium]|nr:PucR family transcriptional regulator [Oscillospiraceae bacterium]